MLHILGFLENGQPGTVKQIQLEEVFEDSEDETTEVHCLKILNGELFCFCNIQTRDQYLAVNHAAFEEASCCTANKKISQLIDSDLNTLVDCLTLPMNED